MSNHNQSVFEDAYNENELESMVEALQDAMYKLESLYNSDEDRNDIVWTLQQLTKIENLLIQHMP
jgi:hypothetical protein